MDVLVKYSVESPWLTFFLALFALFLAESILKVARSLFIRLCRVVAVACRGWPPAHLDADGDFKPQPKDDAQK